MGTSHEAQERLRAAVVTTHDRPGDYADCVESIAPQVDLIVTVAHAPAEYVWGALVRDCLIRQKSEVTASVVQYQAEVPNISRMWNLGIERVEEVSAGRPYDVAVLNDDVVLPGDWFEWVTAAMRREDAAAGCTRRAADPRMSGYAFILNGDRGLRADEQFRWWYGDDDLERQAKAAGGVAFVDGPEVEHRHPNSTTVGALAQVAKEDRGRYKRKWGLHGI
jgi:hypothetical protein